MEGAEYILKGKALWCYNYEIMEAGALAYAGQLGVSFHRHKGDIFLTGEAIFIEGDEPLRIELSSIREIYHGCDEVYQPGFLKNCGYFNKPLRIEYYNARTTSSVIYLFVTQGIISSNKQWYHMLVSLLS